ncbi:MAG: metalloregulator ArsR/SmtB family transcription factor [Nocardioides sp.]|uniref:ArsR/SmtB family transcription factor n=1 Tax=Nocardioides sp. TaxID=35761 RepID=UPI0039E56339
MSQQGSLVFDALADPTRREILLALSAGELAVGDIADRIEGLGRTTVSSHLRVLRLAGLVSERREGRFRFYSIDPAPASHVVGFVAQVYRDALGDLRDGLPAAEAPAAGSSRRRSSAG